MVADIDSMITEIEADFRSLSAIGQQIELDPRVRAALQKVPRHLFVPLANRALAYENRPLPIGDGQTISQPFIVAYMSQLAALRPGDKVLEVGTGCGYQAAVLAALGGRVFSIERIAGLSARAAENLAAAGGPLPALRIGDGAKGWPEEAPFDAVLVTAAAFGRVPPALTGQLAPGGRLVVPVERESALRVFSPAQDLLLITKGADGQIHREDKLPVAFVPLIEGRTAR